MAGDKLAVIQAEETLAELARIETAVKSLVTQFQALSVETASLSKGLGSGALKELLNAQKQVTQLEAERAKTAKQLIAVEKELANAEIAAAKAIKAKEEAIKAAGLAEQQAIKVVQEQTKANILAVRESEALARAKRNEAKAVADASGPYMQLKKQYEEARNAARDVGVAFGLLSDEYEEANREVAELDAQMKKLSASMREETKAVLNLNSPYQQLNQRHIEARNAARDAGVEHGILSREFLDAAISANKYDLELKKVDAALGQFNRNVGNYHGDMFGLNAQVGQVLRELPNFAISAQTGIISLTNNLPYLADAIQDVNRKSKETKANFIAQAKYAKTAAVEQAILAGATDEAAKAAGRQAEAQIMANYQLSKGPGVMKQLISSLISWQALLIVAITLITTYREEITEWVQELFNAKDALDSVAYSTAKMNEAFEGSEIKDATMQVVEMSNAFDLARKGVVSKTDVLRLYNEGLGKTFGQAKNLSEAEAFLTKHAAKFVEATIAKATASVFLAEAVEQAVKKQRLLMTETAEFVNFWDKTLAFLQGFGPLGIVNYQDRVIANAEKRRQKQIKEADANNKTLIEQWKKSMADAAKSAKDIPNFNLFDLAGLTDPSKSTTKGTDPKSTLLDQYNAAKELLDQINQVRESFLKNQQKLIASDPNMSEVMKIDEQAKVYDNLAALNTTYYDSLIENARRYSQEQFIPDFERTKDMKGYDLEADLLQLLYKRVDAVKSDFEYQQRIEESMLSRTQEERKQAVLNDKSLTVEERAYRLSRLEAEASLENLKLSKQTLENRLTYLKGQENSGEITRAEKEELIQLNAELAKTDNLITESERSLQSMDFKRIMEELDPLASFLTEGLDNLGLDRVADQFSSMFDRIKKEGSEFKLTAMDILKASVALFADIGTQLVESAKNRRIALLDEQLDYSREVYEQETSFIEGRLNQLNALETMTREQMEERNALEDEARVFREQQANREKQIAIQKAKAEQRAQAQQALISAGVAAVNSYASLAAIPIVGPALGAKAAAVALGFGVLQSALIMARDPIPKYFIGRKGGDAEWAWTQEKGREVITDKRGNIKSMGSDKGPTMTWLDKGDKVYTATETRKLLGGLPTLDADYVNRGIMQPIVMPSDVGTNRTLTEGEVERAFDKVMRRYDKPVVWTDVKGNVFKQVGSSIPEYLGKERKRPIKITLSKNERN